MPTNNDLLFDLSDVDMGTCIATQNNAPFQLDLSSLFTDNTYDSVPTEMQSSDILSNICTSSKRSPSYDSSSESTTSRDGAVTLDMDVTSSKKTNSIQATLPNFTPLVLTGKPSKLMAQFLTGFSQLMEMKHFNFL